LQEQSIEHVAAVLADLFLPDSTGMETFDRLFHAAPQIPILILTSAQDEEIAKLAVQRKANEYLLKDRLDAYLLPKAVGRMIERAANMEALFEEKERAQVTLNSIGNAVMSTDVSGNVTYLNFVAETITGWSQHEAAGHPFEEVFRIIDSATREIACNPMAFAVRENKTEGLTPNCVLIRRDGSSHRCGDGVSRRERGPRNERHNGILGSTR
jgi:PAS domain S-box-containing protein